VDGSGQRLSMFVDGNDGWVRAWNLYGKASDAHRRCPYLTNFVVGSCRRKLKV
jgi:hypothetical protein